VRKKSLLALLAIATFAAAVVAGLGASAASAGEVTGNCNHAGSDQAAENCKGAEESGRVSNGNSWCSFSGQNDNPDNPLTDENPGGNTQNWGQDVSKNHVGIVDPSQAKGGSPSPGTECNPTKDHNVVPDGSPPRK
jgi:opacity protein-like surface antigen